MASRGWKGLRIQIWFCTVPQQVHFFCFGKCVCLSTGCSSFARFTWSPRSSLLQLLSRDRKMVPSNDDGREELSKTGATGAVFSGEI